MALLLVHHNCGLDFTLPVVLQAFLVFYGAAGTIGARSPNQRVSHIAAAAKAVYLHLLDDSSPE